MLRESHLNFPPVTHSSLAVPVPKKDGNLTDPSRGRFQGGDGVHHVERWPLLLGDQLFSLKNAPATFQNLIYMMQEVLTGYRRDFTMVYYTTIIIYSTDHALYLKHFALVFKRLQKLYKEEFIWST